MFYEIGHRCHYCTKILCHLVSALANKLECFGLQPGLIFSAESLPKESNLWSLFCPQLRESKKLILGGKHSSLRCPIVDNKKVFYDTDTRKKEDEEERKKWMKDKELEQVRISCNNLVLSGYELSNIWGVLGLIRLKNVIR